MKKYLLDEETKKGKQNPKALLQDYQTKKYITDLETKLNNFQTKSYGGGGGGGASYAPSTANLDRESVKSDIMELKEKTKEQGRAISALEQYKQQLLNEQKQQQNPRQYMGEWLDFDEPEVRARQNQVKLLEAEQDKLDTQLEIAVDGENDDQIAEIQKQQADVAVQLAQEKIELKTVKRVTRAKAKKATEDRLADEEYQNRMFLQELRGQKRPPGRPFEPAPHDLGDAFAAAEELPVEAVLEAVAAASKIPKPRAGKKAL
jgi:hypothetical protein